MSSIIIQKEVNSAELDTGARKRSPIAAAVQRGMTLIEIMVVLVIIGMIAGAVAVNVMSGLKDARIRQTKADLKTLEQCLDLLKADKGQYPTTEEGLQAVVTAGKCKQNMKDPWGHEYIYVNPGQVHPDGFDLKSYGADGAPGGEGENADIVNAP